MNVDPATASGTGPGAPASAHPEPVLRTRNLTKQFGQATVLQDVCLDVAPGERLALIGRSGSGKTTFLRCLNLLETPTAGELWFDGSLVGSWPSRGRDSLSHGDEVGHRTHVGMVFQRFELFPHLTTLQNVSLGPRRTLRMSKTEARKCAMEQLSLVGLADRADARPHELSGGQQQRVGIARSLAMRPKVLLFDEPTSALDPELVDEVLNVMLRVAEGGMTMVVVTHEIRFAMGFADRLVVFDSGCVVEQGAPSSVVASPQSDVTESLLRSLHVK